MHILYVYINFHVPRLSFISDLSAFLGGAYAIQWFFAGVSIIGFFFALLVLPETHGKKLSEIEAYFSGERPKARKSAVPKNGTAGSTVQNRKPTKPTLETVKESERMIKEVV